MRMLACLLCALLPVGGFAAMHRFSLAHQDDWGAQRGFYLNFENEAEGEGTCRLATLRLFLGVGDGKEWRFIHADGPWHTGREYRARVVITAKAAEMYLDGHLVGRAEGGFAPQPGPVRAGYTFHWADGRADYLVVQTGLALRAGGKEQRANFGAASHPLPLLLFAPHSPARLDWASPRQGLTLEVTFRLEPYPDLKALAPFVDEFGQCRYADWPGKVRSDEDLQRSAREEEARLVDWGKPAGYDRYGGATGLGWKEEATGFYRAAKHHGRWWLITPEGNPCFYTGICTAPAPTWDQTPVSGREFLWASLPEGPGWGENPWGPDPGVRYFAPHAANMVRKYGPGWLAKTDALMARRLAAWGFSGIGKWGGMAGTPYVPVLSRREVPNLVRHPDVFDPAVQRTFRESLRAQIAPHRQDPLVVGWSLGNEVEEIIYQDEVAAILKGKDSPAKRALIAHAAERTYAGDLGALARAWQAPGRQGQALYAAPLTPPKADLEQARRHYADAYYGFAYRTVKELDPNHLYLGSWMIPGAWENEEDWRLQARHCDVFGYDLYSEQFADEWFSGIIRRTGKPIFCGEFSYPAWYGGARGFGMYGVWAEDDAASGEAYARWLQAAARNPYCIGACWFQYRDEPITGRGPGHGQDLVYGENFAFGFVDVADRPKWDLVTRVRAANLQVAKWRNSLSPGRR